MKIQSGTISNWNKEKGFGFIVPHSGGKAMFAHITDYSKRHKTPIRGLKVQYFLSTDPKGRKCAVEVRPLKGHKNNGRELRQKKLSLVLFISFAGVLFFLFTSNLIPLALVGLYAAMSIIAFLMYARDKSAAQRDAWRTPENTLHILSLAGGWPGAAVAQSFLRHKSKKLSFRVTYWITVLVNCGALGWLTTPEGKLWINSVVKNFKFS